MPQYKLMYFNSRGRAEVVRCLFALSDIQYEDVRVPDEEWPTLKERMTGKSDIEEAIIDSYVLAMYDLGNETTVFFTEEDEAKKSERRKTFKDDTLPNVFQKFEAILCNSSTGYLIGDEINLADVALYNILDWLCIPTMVGLVDEDMASYPKILDHERKIRALPKMAAWIAKRPDTAL